MSQQNNVRPHTAVWVLNCLQSLYQLKLNLPIRRMGQDFSLGHFLHAYGLLLNEEEKIYSGKHGPEMCFCHQIQNQLISFLKR